MEGNTEKPKKEKIPRQAMPEQDPGKRIGNFDEVPLGYPPETAMREAARCIQCKKPGCVAGCPVDVKIPEFIKQIAAGDFLGAARTLKETNSLPAVCGRVCPQEDQCEKTCILGKKGEPVAIGRLERFAADYERSSGAVALPECAPPNGKKVAVVGAGPSGLTIAGDLVKLGYDITVFEALHKAGGVLVYGIPEFRLPKAIVEAEVDYLRRLGVKIVVNAVIGRLKTIDELFAEGFDAVYVAVGAGAPVFMNIPGENLSGIYSANEYLTRSNLMKAYRFPEYDTPIVRGRNVAVIGGGNVAMDSVRTALRLGAENAFIIYRRSEVEMPARKEEVHHAKEEGVQFHLLTNPVEYLGEGGWVRGVKCLRMELGEPDASGRRSPVAVPGSEFVIAVDTVVVAVGTMANPIVPATTPGLETNRRGYIVVKGESGETTRPGVYAGGDIVTGSATVILAMGAGRKAAQAIHRALAGENTEA
ncbi:MAG TPA: NADPH-dependent glutamate synthase [Syntrophales bacterium]|jgi:glutamate synthase (NADPH/NADH) small chain|nr:NADPH-dependent glutamate synthase [Syntrophales bacterium]HPC31543.1 NADPH-dependent glutamate synthase [Syntrophales bacterium]HQG34784.1 NADPH-dependent glutamate synthase [Syntrophales bacterium]HQI34846.1 NADPH-dependent glutamate synthase [Syntrophales bacterium]HQJ30995.1 NADPH-dependent glutamate synthase [Syntrophales bacterium]